jgi:DNA-binding NarL/FixJ family response regulator
VCRVTENVIVRSLRGIAAKLTANAELQKDLMQEMFLHLAHVETVEAGQTLSWYLKGCEFHARNYLKRGRSVDSFKRAHNGVALDETPSDEDRHSGNGTQAQPSGPVQIQGEIITQDVVNQIVPRLTDMQQRVLFLLLKGYGVREAAREIGITHPAVIKHRKKIARIARELLQESDKLASGDANGIGDHESPTV